MQTKSSPLHRQATLRGDRAESQSGFTLIEILVATTLFVGLISVMMTAIVSANKISKPENLKGVASNFGREQLEELYDAVRSDFFDVPGNPLSPGTDLGTTTFVVNGITYTRSYDVADTPGRQYRRVDVKITSNEDSI